MTRKEFLDKLKSIASIKGVKLSSVEAMSLATISLKAEAKLQDGTSLWTDADTFAAGVPAYTQADGADPMPAAPGEYILADGSTIVVGDAGMVAEIKAQAAPAEAEMSAEEMLPVMEELATNLEATTAELATTKESLTTATTELSKVKAELAASKVELSALKKKAAPDKVVKLAADEEISPARQARAERERVARLIEEAKSN